MVQEFLIFSPIEVEDKYDSPLKRGEKLSVGWIKALVFAPNPPILFSGKVDSLSLNPPYF